MNNQKKWLAIGLVAVLAMGVVGCKKTSSASTDENATSPVNTVESNAEGVTEVSESSNPYASIIKMYQEKIKYVTQPEAAKSEKDQQASVDAMEMLNKSSASSKEIFTLFKADIGGLRGTFADAFTQAAISGLRRNSFKDYSQTETYFSDMAHLQKFFHAGDR